MLQSGTTFVTPTVAVGIDDRSIPRGLERASLRELRHRLIWLAGLLQQSMKYDCQHQNSLPTNNNLDVHG